ncbi:hypothetical protein CCR75_001762 [Bremia lactucae]|uniref:PX domain-containing protein n=1 Tax=Bremia lactucae TaxID=4779 RepID=A0A976FSK3_BRELC|nr:hypothetical protein CCR75_001762 [Bremia lactucae]
MPGQSNASSVVASPTTLAPCLKALNEPWTVVPVREGRSLSLSTLPRRASTASVLTVDATHGLLSEEDGVNRIPRRVFSSSGGCSLSLLQQELGYPRRARVAVDGHRHHRRRSLFETTMEQTMKRAHSSGHSSGYGKECHRSYSLRSADSASAADLTLLLPEPEGETQIDQLQQASHSWTGSPKSEGSNGISDDRERMQEEDEEEENFLDYRCASVTGYSRDTDGVVYYEVIVRSTAHGPLSAYKVRRRYSEFRDLHAALSKVMRVSHQKLASVTALANISDEHNDEHSSVGLCFSVNEWNRALEPALPPLPDKGGVWSYLQFDSIPLLERRAQYFHAMLVAAQRHAVARSSRLLHDFVGTPPDLVSQHSSVENSYVSLNRFAAPKLSFDIEIQERKEKAKSIRRRRQTFLESGEASCASLTP